jgi:uncharacterized protein (DUF58 family)
MTLRVAKQRTPGRPGPGPTPPAVLRALDLTVRRRVQGLLPGEHPAPGVGAGTELAQIRPYQPGDDVRQIDPSASARTREPHVRVHVPERALTTWLVLDFSASMAFGTADRRKVDVLEGVAIALGHLATRRGNRLGVTTFGQPQAASVPAREGRAGLLGALGAIGGEPQEEGGGATSLGAALLRAGRLARTRGAVVVVSDFRGPRDWFGPLAALRGRHGVLCVEIRDPREQELPDVGQLWLVDPETGRQLRVDTRRRLLRERFAAAAADERADLARELRRAGADHVVLSTRGDWLRELAAQMRGRARCATPARGALD